MCPSLAPFTPCPTSPPVFPFWLLLTSSFAQSPVDIFHSLSLHSLQGPMLIWHRLHYNAAWRVKHCYYLLWCLEFTLHLWELSSACIMATCSNHLYTWFEGMSAISPRQKEKSKTTWVALPATVPKRTISYPNCFVRHIGKHQGT